MKKILFLGGASHQISILNLAKKNYFIILCDNDSHCIGKKYADKFYKISIKCKNKILKISRKEKIDAIISYASEIGALTQCYVANKLKLPSNNYNSIKTLHYKNEFRSFLNKNNFFVPPFKIFTNYENFKNYIKNTKKYFIIKPIDSAGSRGIFKVNYQQKLNLKKIFLESKKQSEKGKVICEEFVNTNMPQIAGDAIILNKKIIFSHWGDQYYDKSLNSLLPLGESWPTIHERKTILNLEIELNRLFKKLNISFGVFNFDIRLTSDKKLMFIEIGPRNGGDYIDDVVKYATGVDMIEQTINLCLGKKIIKRNLIKKKNLNCASFRIGASKNGYLNKLNFSKELKKTIYKKYIKKKRGDLVYKFINGKNSLGNIFMKFKNFNNMIKVLNNINEHIEVNIKKN